MEVFDKAFTNFEINLNKLNKYIFVTTTNINEIVSGLNNKRIEEENNKNEINCFFAKDSDKHNSNNHLMDSNVLLSKENGFNKVNIYFTSDQT